MSDGKVTRGGRRPGAGRPVGVRNRPVLVHGLPETQDPAAWLLALMQCEIAPLRLRLSAARALLPYHHPRGGIQTLAGSAA
jgi:hypothetical protein